MAHRAELILSHITMSAASSLNEPKVDERRRLRLHPVSSSSSSSSSTDSSSSSSSFLTPSSTITNWINGHWVDPTTNAYLPLLSPADGKSIGRVANSGSADVDAAVAAAAAAFPAWSKLTSKSRSQFLHRYRVLLIEYEDELAECIVREHGKTKGEAIGEVQKGNETVEWACGLPSIMQGRILEVSNGVTCHEVREPLGVVASIVPFNFPHMVPHWTLPIAIAAGNTLVLKPSEKVPSTLSLVARLLQKAGIPDGVVNIVNGTVDVVNRICDHPDIKAVSFVGSSKVAEIVSHRGRLNNKRVLALGAAKNHLVALPDCNIDMASTDIVNSFTGCCGQRCMAASALIAVTPQPDLIQAIVSKASKLVPGQAAAGTMGPLIDGAALKRVTSYIDEAEKEGAKILLDGRKWTQEKKEGFWIGPTIIEHSAPSARAFTDEIFGPVLSLVVVETKEQAIEIENRSPYGNAACIYTTVGAHAEWFSSRFHTGMVGVNIGVPVPREPFSFGGWNASRYGDLDITGDGGLEFWTKKKKISTKWAPPERRGHGDWMS